MVQRRKPKPNPAVLGNNRVEIMTLQEVALYLGLHYLTIYRLIRERKIPAAKVGGSWRFKKDVIDRWIETDMGNHYDETGTDIETVNMTENPLNPAQEGA